MSVLGQDESESGLRLEKARHIKYWARCLKTLLPHQYTGNDSNRMYLAYFIVGALDLLGSLDSVASEDERRDHINWVYRCQHPKGGFRMWPGTDLGEHTNEANAGWDPATIPATFFALSTLLIYKDNFDRLKRKETLQWLHSMQRPDGSFGESLINERIEGGRDPRFGYCASGIRYMLRGDSEGPISVDGQSISDIDVDGLVRCIRAAESFEGGIADEPFHEPHAGYTFCSIGALALLGRLRLSNTLESGQICAPGNPQSVIKWLVSRQTELMDPDASLDSEFIGWSHPLHVQLAEDQTTNANEAAVCQPVYQLPHRSTAGTKLEMLTDGAGMNGRTNKVADTCYAFWSTAPLHIMRQPDIYNQDAIRRYLLLKTQHPVLGGFGKFPGDLPDLYHSYLGLAALSLAGSDDIKELDGGLCMSKEARDRLPALWKSWQSNDQESTDCGSNDFANISADTRD